MIESPAAAMRAGLFRGGTTMRKPNITLIACTVILICNALAMSFHWISAEGGLGILAAATFFGIVSMIGRA